MEKTGTTHLRDRAVDELSGGERRLVQIAAALAQETRIMVLDEPGVNLDFRHQVALWLLLRKLAGSGISILVTTHELSIAGRFLDRAVLVASGRMRACSTPEEAFTSEMLTSVYGIPIRVISGPESSILVVPEGVDSPTQEGEAER